jgi:DNA-binding transcriptional regulator YiaG
VANETLRMERDEHAHAHTEARVAMPEGLAPTASAGERIAALRGTGLSAEDIAQALGVSANTIRSWGEDGVAPRRSTERALDDLRLIVLALIESGIGDAQAAMWLRSRNRDFLEGARPLDSLRDDPLMVIAAAEGLILGFSDEGEQTAEEHQAADVEAVPC